MTTVIISFLIFGTACFLLGTLYKDGKFKSGWSKWQDVGVIYDSTDYTYSMLQLRRKKDGSKQYRRVKIVRWANLPSNMIQVLDKDKLV